ncbi:thioredoxin family protein [Metabacillus idriensis]|uniref:Thioredoxin n=1 Tax=Metabacillus idriensis TaxID=324768 RepID=A0A6I2MDT8_9BACI|nr:thioredoxin family protein [Metabacillus idriensis]MCM3597660.1 thioredoxin family protein [Metabacillus idriensis]MRX54571.1 thioredoxin [Metabacillus idriensis]OHR65823.1 thiol reductase thioredoxin [Bacillus sp. HMSC76G11]
MIEIQEEQLDIFAEKEFGILYLYTPFCGTCQLAKKMLTVVEELLPGLTIHTANLNFLPKQAIKWGIESVPCMLIFENGEVAQKIYAFHSVEHIYQIMKEYAA